MERIPIGIFNPYNTKTHAFWTGQINPDNENSQNLHRFFSTDLLELHQSGKSLNEIEEIIKKSQFHIPNIASYKPYQLISLACFTKFNFNGKNIFCVKESNNFRIYDKSCKNKNDNRIIHSLRIYFYNPIDQSFFLNYSYNRLCNFIDEDLNLGDKLLIRKIAEKTLLSGLEIACVDPSIDPNDLLNPQRNEFCMSQLEDFGFKLRPYRHKTFASPIDYTSQYASITPLIHKP